MHIIFLKIIFFLIILKFILVFILKYFCFIKKKTLHEILYPNDYNIEFNEKKYMPTKNVDKYKKIVSKGFNLMKTKKLVIGGLFLNSSQVFHKFKGRMNNLRKYFADVQIVIFENDSIDNSRILLLNWEKEQNNIHIIRCKENSYCLLNEIPAIEHGGLSELRMKKMVRYRNYVKKYVDDNFSDYDYFMVIDTDAKGSFSLNGMAYSFGINTNWDLMSAYGAIGKIKSLGFLEYYDYFAYLGKNLDYKKILEINLINKNDDLIPVENAFGSLTIYKMSSIRNVNYTPHDNNYICEHTIFSNNMKFNGFNKFYINPKFIYLVGKQGPDKLDYY